LLKPYNSNVAGSKTDTTLINKISEIATQLKNEICSKQLTSGPTLTWDTSPIFTNLIISGNFTEDVKKDRVACLHLIQYNNYDITKPNTTASIQINANNTLTFRDVDVTYFNLGKNTLTYDEFKTLIYNYMKTNSVSAARDRVALSMFYDTYSRLSTENKGKVDAKLEKTNNCN